GHLMGITVEPPRRRRDAHALEQFECARPGLAPGSALVSYYGLGDLVADPIDRVERKPRLLEDHRDGGAAIGCEIALRQFPHVVSIDPDLAADDGASVRQETH